MGEGTAGESVQAPMEELRLTWDAGIPAVQRRVDAVSASFRKSLETTKSRVQETVQLQEKLKKVKAELREAEDGLVKAIGEKTRKEAKRMSLVESLSASEARMEQLKRAVEAQRARRDEYAGIIAEASNDLKECEEKRNQNSEHRDGVEEAILWYNKNLGFRIECGNGVRFIFTKINMKTPHEEYFFTIRHESDTYSLLDCNPSLDGIKDLLTELNQSNGLYKFVRTMREKFQEAALCGNFPKVTSHDQNTPATSISVPSSSIPTESGSESPSEQRDPQAEELNKDSVTKKLRNAKGGRSGLLSPGSASSHRRSPRFKVKK
ncbi:unnamed protein product [Cuscuta campestris]|uniref:Kinetochore protein SPC25 n=1 Tax=Cuscuta campestris TaxID=132261 RepID=A0A484N455_9ASTE|nr:unnamed protein product [Cuscuta campestris]